jgi:hypothetical protein
VNLKTTAVDVVALYSELAALVTVTEHVDPATPEVRTPVVLIEQALFAPSVAAYETAPLPDPPEVVTWKLFV